MKKLFASNLFFTIVALLAAAGFGVFGIFYMSTREPIRIISGTILVMCAFYLLILLAAFRKGDQSTVKSMMSVLLSAIVVDACSECVALVFLSDKIILPIYLLLSVLLLVNHFTINEGKRRTSSAIRLNFLFVLLLMADLEVWTVLYIPLRIGVLGTAASVMTLISFPCLAASVVCIESRIDAYRLDGQAAAAEISAS